MATTAPRRILLAWEGGAGRGHIVTLKEVAQALGPSFIYDAALCDMKHADEIAPFCDLAFKGALLGVARRPAGAPRTASWGEFMGDLGFRSEEFVHKQVKWWQEVIDARLADLVVGDYSPCALIAARSMGVPAVAIGTGYGIPPQGLTEFPIYLEEHATRIYPEAETVAIINAAIRPLGCAPLEHLSDAYLRAGELVRTLELFDPYSRDVPRLPPVADTGAQSDGAGDEVFAYFSTSETGEAAIVEAVLGAGLKLRVFMPGADDATRDRFRAAGAIVELAPVPHELIAKRSRMMINSGQHGILSLGLAAGLPQLCLPQHLEHLYHARRAEQAGAARVILKADQTDRQLISDALAATYADTGMAARARDIARDIAPEVARDAPALIRERLLPLLA